MPDSAIDHRGRPSRALRAAEVGSGLALVVAATNGPRLFTAADRRANALIDKLRERELGRIGQAWGLNEYGGAVNAPSYRGVFPGQPGYAPAASPAERAANSQARKRLAQRTQKINRLTNVSRKAVRLATGSGARRKAMAAGFIIGVPVAWHGARESVDKRLSREDIDSGFSAGAAGAGGYQLGMYSTKPIDRMYDSRLKSLIEQERSGKPSARKPSAEILAEHERASGFAGSKPPQGDPRWLGYNRNYPKALPGAAWRRTMSHLHGGKTGVALTVASGATAAAAGVSASRSRRVKKDADALIMPSWYQVGIPASRSLSDPISPLAMYASGRIMLDNSAALLGRNLTKRQKKEAGKKAYQIAGARGVLYSPLGMIG